MTIFEFMSDSPLLAAFIIFIIAVVVSDAVTQNKGGDGE